MHSTPFFTVSLFKVAPLNDTYVYNVSHIPEEFSLFFRKIDISYFYALCYQSKLGSLFMPSHSVTACLCRNRCSVRQRFLKKQLLSIISAYKGTVANTLF